MLWYRCEGLQKPSDLPRITAADIEKVISAKYSETYLKFESALKSTTVQTEAEIQRITAIDEEIVESQPKEMLACAVKAAVVAQLEDLGLMTKDAPMSEELNELSEMFINALKPKNVESPAVRVGARPKSKPAPVSLPYPEIQTSTS